LYGHEIAYYLLIFFPLFFVFYPQKLHVPKIMAFFTILMLFFIILSTFYSINIAKSVSIIFLYPALFLLTIYVLNNKSAFEEIIIKIIRFGSVIFVLLSYWNIIIGKLHLVNINPLAGYGLIYDRASSHNNIGDFLLLFIVYGLYKLLTGKISKADLILLIISLPIFAISNSRTAFLSLFITTVTVIFYSYRNLNMKKSKIILLTSVFVLLIFNLFHGINYLKKDVLGNRLSFYLPSVKAIVDYPATGVGMGNFDRISHRYNDQILFWSNSAHNLFLEIANELGIVASILLMTIIAFTLIKAKKNLMFFLFIALLLNFQLYYGYRIYSLIMIFFILWGLIFEKTIKGYQVDPGVFKKYLILPALYVQLIFISTFFKYFGYANLALINPFDKTVYPQLITQSSVLTKLYDRVFYSDIDANEVLFTLYMAEGNRSEALKYLKRSFVWSPFEGDVRDRLNRAYSLLVFVEGKENADNFIRDYVIRLDKMHTNTDAGRDIEKKVIQFLEENNLNHLQA